MNGIKKAALLTALALGIGAMNVGIILPAESVFAVTTEVSESSTRLSRICQYLTRACSYDDIADISGGAEIDAFDLVACKRTIIQEAGGQQSESIPYLEAKLGFTMVEEMETFQGTTVAYRDYASFAEMEALLEVNSMLDSMTHTFDETFFETHTLVVSFTSGCVYETRADAYCYTFESLFEQVTVQEGGASLDYFTPVSAGMCYFDLQTDMIAVVFDNETLAQYGGTEISFAPRNITESLPSGEMNVQTLLTTAEAEDFDLWVTDTETLDTVLESVVLPAEAYQVSLGSTETEAEAAAAAQIEAIRETFDEAFFAENRLFVASLETGTVMNFYCCYGKQNMQLLCVGEEIDYSVEPDQSTFFVTIPKSRYTGERLTVFWQDMMMVDKPVIYLYPEETTDVTVTLDIDGSYACVYPEFNNGDSSWFVTAQPDGTLTTPDGGEYAYLFWEAQMLQDWDMSEGFVVKGTDTAAFLQEKLAKMGLSSKESNDFIVYWLPRMQQNAYNYVTFQQEVYTDAAALEISPAPDSTLRVFMAYTALTAAEAAQMNPNEPEITGFVRDGFTVVEWGGTCMDE